MPYKTILVLRNRLSANSGDSAYKIIRKKPSKIIFDDKKQTRDKQLCSIAHYIEQSTCTILKNGVMDLPQEGC